jgi:hypothetical protein
MKVCKTCFELKDLELFPKNKRLKDGYHYVCKACRKAYNLLNGEKIKEYRELNKEKQAILIKKWGENNQDKIKEYTKDNNSKKTKESIKLNNQKQKIYKVNWNKNRYATNIGYKISQLLRIRLVYALKIKKNKHKSAIDLIGCTIEECRNYLEAQFYPEMNWENHGKIWEIDHIKPCASFDLTNLEEQEKCFHYTNIQPLFKTTEIAKSLGYNDIIGNRDKSDNFKNVSGNIL